MTNSVAGLFVAEVAAEVARERIGPNALDRLGIAMACVELATALGVAEILPVRGLVAGACEARLRNEGFEQDRAKGVARVPVLGQASAGQGAGARSKIMTVIPRQDADARVVDDAVQVLCSALSARRSARTLAGGATCV